MLFIITSKLLDSYFLYGYSDTVPFTVNQTVLLVDIAYIIFGLPIMLFSGIQKYRAKKRKITSSILEIFWIVIVGLVFGLVLVGIFIYLGIDKKIFFHIPDNRLFAIRGFVESIVILAFIILLAIKEYFEETIARKQSNIESPVRIKQ